MARRKKPDEDQPHDSSESFNESDDTFGLPEIEYEPIKREETEPEEAPAEEQPVTPEAETTSYSEPERTEEPVEESKPYFEDVPRYEDTSKYSTYRYVEEPGPVWPKALLIVFAIVAVVGTALWYFLYYQPAQEEGDRIAAANLAASQENLRKEKARQDSIKQIEDAQRQRIADSLAQIPPTPMEGVVETLSGRTGHYYVVVASNVDDDLLMDYAKKLSSEGVSSKIIPPYGKVKFYRLAIAEGDTWSTTQATADGLKGDYGSDLWVIKY